MAQPTGRSAAWTDVGMWMLDTLESHLGTDWPATVVAKSPDGSAPELAWAAGHVTAYTNLLERALRLELLATAPGRAKIRKALIRDPRPDQLYHVDLQLEVAGLALQAGCAPHLEPEFVPNHPADIAFDWRSRSVIVEARAVLTSEPWRDEQMRTDDIFARIHATERAYGVRCEGRLSRNLNDLEADELMRRLDSHARLVSVGAVPPPLRFAGANLQVVPRAHESGSGLGGPDMGGDTWIRIGSRIGEKARDALESGATWLRLDARNGLWQFTPWSQRSLRQKLVDIAAIARPQLGGLSGLVLSSGALLTQGEFDDEDVAAPDGAVGMRRLLAPLRVRETLVVPAAASHCVEDGDDVTETFWQAVYASEPEWLSWALQSLGLPTPAEIFGG